MSTLRAPSNRREAVGDEMVEVSVGRALDVEGATADIVDGLVIDHDGDISVLEQGVGREHGVVRLNNGGRDLRRRVDSEAKLGLLAVVDGQALEEERAKAGTGTTTNGVEHEEALETSAIVGKLAH